MRFLVPAREIHAEHPSEPLPPRGFDVHDRRAFLRARLADLIARLDVQPCEVPSERQIWDDVFAWLHRCAEHTPDLADGWLAVLSQRERKLRLWTYDAEFERLWRRPDGGRVPLFR